ncbi:hypothetical protein [Nocardioides daeguensis]|uniref:RiboL-PSP-HEPN domain-containing protein n=1 Tax=Nocardioides daeguensis TaxID=908359 RepID=A0ABP6VPQ9_9ACTN|nr:hypothetical protein [Nocardioides daeguensis]MBV6728575.1 hypothetical protein [Nocardioides daeguensis]MCR1773999.1 hypothetical protein [Nocardioides daeguensis]
MPVSPFQAAIDVLDRADALLTLDSGSGSVLDADLRRQALVMGVAGLDTWMHWKIHRVPLDALSQNLAEIAVPFANLVEMGERSVEARKQGVRDRPMVRARNALHAQLLRITFQSARDWQRGFNLLGVRSGFTAVGAAMVPSEAKADIESRLNQLSHRRNQVVHEGDLMRQAKPRAIRHNDLEAAKVADDLLWIRRFLTAVDSMV